MKQTLIDFYNNERNTLVKKYNRRAGSPENAEDVVQEAFTRALQYIDSYDPSKKELGAWFYTILQNSLRDFKREDKNGGMVMFEEEHMEPTEFVDLDKEVRNELHNLIDTKNDVAKEVLTLYFRHGYMIKDIDNTTDHSYAAIKAIILRFKKEVKEKYAESVRGGLGS